MLGVQCLFLTNGLVVHVVANFYITGFLTSKLHFNVSFNSYFFKLMVLQLLLVCLNKKNKKIKTSYRSSVNWNHMQSNHFHNVVVNDLYNPYSTYFGIMRLWAQVGNKLYTTECFLKNYTRIYPCFKHKVVMNINTLFDFIICDDPQEYNFIEITFGWGANHIWLHTKLVDPWPHYMTLEVPWDGFGTLSFGLSQFHGHGTWLMCEVTLYDWR